MLGWDIDFPCWFKAYAWNQGDALWGVHFEGTSSDHTVTNLTPQKSNLDCLPGYIDPKPSGYVKIAMVMMAMEIVDVPIKNSDFP